jgi:hypothetical protein
MKRTLTSLLLLAALLFSYAEAEACTAAVVAAKASKEGGTILWKNRESNYYRTSVRYLTSEKYAYTGVVRTDKPEAGVFCGVNEVGFGIINTASSNLPKDKELEGTGSRPPFMRDALINCSTVDEFEEFVKQYKRGHTFTTNVGVGDANGAAAFFEIWGHGYRRYDIDKTEKGYDFRSSFSFAGDMEKIRSPKRRYNAMVEQTEGKSLFAARDFYDYARTYYVAGKGNALENENKLWNHRFETVPHRSTVGTFMVVCGKHPRILVSMGYPAACPAIPVWVEAKESIPECLSGTASHKLGHRFMKAAYIKEGTYISKGKKKGRYYLNKPLVREALKVKTNLHFPEKMPKNIDKFNRKTDKAFDKHERKIDALIVRLSAK